MSVTFQKPKSEHKNALFPKKNSIQSMKMYISTEKFFLVTHMCLVLSQKSCRQKKKCVWALWNAYPHSNMSVTFQKPLFWAQKCLVPNKEFHPVPCLSTKMPCSQQILPPSQWKMYVSTQNCLVYNHKCLFCYSKCLVLSQKSCYQKKYQFPLKMTVRTKENHPSIKDVSSALKNALLYNKIPVYAQKYLLTHESASFNHKKISICTHKCLSNLKYVCHFSKTP